METKKTEIVMEDCIKGDLERMGKEWNNYKTTWILLTENVVRKKLEEEKRQ